MNLGLNVHSVLGRRIEEGACLEAGRGLQGGPPQRRVEGGWVLPAGALAPGVGAPGAVGIAILMPRFGGSGRRRHVYAAVSIHGADGPRGVQEAWARDGGVSVDGDALGGGGGGGAGRGRGVVLGDFGSGARGRAAWDVLLVDGPVRIQPQNDASRVVQSG